MPPRSSPRGRSKEVEERRKVRIVEPDSEDSSLHLSSEESEHVIKVAKLERSSKSPTVVKKEPTSSTSKRKVIKLEGNEAPTEASSSKGTKIKRERVDSPDTKPRAVRKEEGATDEVIDDLVEIQNETERRNGELNSEIEKRVDLLLPKALKDLLDKQDSLAIAVHEISEAQKEEAALSTVKKENGSQDEKVKSPARKKRAETNGDIRDCEIGSEPSDPSDGDGDGASKRKKEKKRKINKKSACGEEESSDDDAKRAKADAKANEERQTSLSRLVSEKHPVPTLEEALGSVEMACFYRKALREADVFKENEKEQTKEEKEALARYKTRFPDTQHTLKELSKCFKEVDETYIAAMEAGTQFGSTPKLENTNSTPSVTFTPPTPKSTPSTVASTSPTSTAPTTEANEKQKSRSKLSKETELLDPTESESSETKEESETECVKTRGNTRQKVGVSPKVKVVSSPSKSVKKGEVAKGKGGKKDKDKDDGDDDDDLSLDDIETEEDEDDGEFECQSETDELEVKDEERVFRAIQREAKEKGKKRRAAAISVSLSTKPRATRGKKTEKDELMNEKKPKTLSWRKTLRHNGISFPEPYKPHGVAMLYGGKPVDLLPACEELATYIAKDLHLSHVHNVTYTTNFFKEFRDCLVKEKDPASRIIKQFDLCDFTPIKEFLTSKAEFAKHDKDLKNEKKRANEMLMKEYGYGEVDGFPVRLNPIQVEQPGIFKGRGKHPNAGKIKPTIRCEDVTINLDPLAPIPIPPNKGSKWGKLVCNREATWTVSYPSGGRTKYVRPDDTSYIKSLSDFRKFNKSRLLGNYINKIRKGYHELVCSDKYKDKAIGVVVYILDTLAIRGGNKKDTANSADTVGACTLRKEHVRFPFEGKDSRETVVEFDFLGKDSVRFHKRVVFFKEAYEAIRYLYYNDETTPSTSTVSSRPKKLLKKDLAKPLFGSVELSHVNAALGKYMPGLTAKVFRTYNASKKLDELLHSKRYTATVTMSSTVVWRQRFIDANREVAILCNHQTGGTSAVDQENSSKRDEGFNKRLATYTSVLLEYSVQLLVERRRNFKLLCALHSKWKEGMDGVSDEENDKLSLFISVTTTKSRKGKSQKAKSQTAFTSEELEGIEGILDKNNTKELKCLQELEEYKEQKKTTTLQRKATRLEAERLVEQVKEMKAKGDKRSELDIVAELKRKERKTIKKEEMKVKAGEGEDNSEGESGNSNISVKTLSEYNSMTLKALLSNVTRSCNAIFRLKNTINTKMSNFVEAVGNKNVSLTTSRQNYIDPRIVVAFCKEHSVPITKMYSPRLLVKFPWALETEKGWRY